MGSADTHSIYPHVYTKPRFHAQEFVAVAPITRIAYVLMGRPDLPAKSMTDLVAIAKKDKLSYATWGAGSAAHAAMSLFAGVAKTPEMLHVPYTGSAPAAQALMASQVDLMMVPMPVAVASRSKMTVFGVSAPERSDAMKDVPTLAEQGYNVNAEFWIGVLAPPKTPTAVASTIAARIGEAVADPEVAEEAAGAGHDPAPGDAARICELRVRRVRALGPGHSHRGHQDRRMSAAAATATLGRFVATSARAPLRAEVARKAAICMLDALGLAAPRIPRAHVRAMRSLVTPVSEAGARIWADDTRAVLSEAVTANAIAVHALFQDDNDVPSWSHPASLVTPVAVCAGEAEDASIEQVLRAVAIGYGTIAWLGARERLARALIRRGIRTSPTLGTIAAAAAAAAIYRLDDDQATSAVGIASSITGGVLEPVGSGSDEWRLQNAHAARGGLLAAQLAAKGMHGAARGLEGAKGLMRSLAGLDEVPEWEAPPTVDTILDVWAKPWATLGDNVPAVVAAHALRASGIDVSRITRLDVTLWRHYAEYPGTSYRGPYDTVAQALASTAFGVSAMLALGELDYGVSVNRRSDPRHCQAGAARADRAARRPVA